MRDELYDHLALILAQGSDGMDTDLADEELTKQMSVSLNDYASSNKMAVELSEDRYMLCLRKCKTGMNSKKVY